MHASQLNAVSSNFDAECSNLALTCLSYCQRNMVRDTGSINHFTTANQRQPTKSLLGFVTYHSNKILLASL